MRVRFGRCLAAWVPLTMCAIAGCSAAVSARALRAAEQGDETVLREVIAAGEKAGTLSNGDAAAVARAVGSREIR
ncbi:MAG: hypothetical protein M3O50_17035, partial [Myxococcota bacterium]|nr:hypothetical protein [Myxococcota bacterium]